MWHPVRLSRRGAHQRTSGQRHDRNRLQWRESPAPLHEPAARPERETRPLERQLRDERDESRAVGAERGADRQHVHPNAADQESVCDLPAEPVAVGSHDAEQHRPCRDREVVGRERNETVDTRSGCPAGFQVQSQEVADRWLHGPDRRDRNRRSERRGPDSDVGSKKKSG
jgi:hypothetical protein